jgi:hypothetical protein
MQQFDSSGKIANRTRMSSERVLSYLSHSRVARIGHGIVRPGSVTVQKVGEEEV